jgi:hypothetical protein
MEPPGDGHQQWLATPTQANTIWNASEMPICERAAEMSGI